jgi:hypothetical protein
VMRNTAITLRKWKAPAQKMALRQHRATNSALIADHKIVAAGAAGNKGADRCAEGRAISQRGRCRPSAIY